MLVSVVVPTCHRPQLLARCLEALLNQTLDPAVYEILVADDGPSEKTKNVVARCCDTVNRAGRPAVRYLPVTETQGPAAARNRGWRAAAGAIIAFTDDDCIPDADWLRSGLAAFTDGVDGAWGRLVMPLPSSPTDYELNASNLEAGEFVTANCFYRRSALASAGGFDQRFQAAWCEDSDLFFTLLERGARLVRVPEAVVVHPLRPGHWGISVREQRKSMYKALLYKKHPELYRRRMTRPFVWDYYAIVGALVGVAAGAAAGRRRLAAGSAAAWALLTGRFCARRLRRTSRAPGHVAEMVVTSALIPPLSVFWRLRGALKYRVPFL